MRSLLTAALILAPGLALATTYEVDPAHTSASFTVKHMMVTNVRGEFSKVSGTVNFDDKNPTRSTVEATIDAASVTTRNDMRDNHLRSPDFFDVQKFPTITFKSTKVTSAGKGKLKVDGELTIHGVTKPVILNVEGPSPEMKDPFGNVRRGLTATTHIKRSDYGLKWNKALEGGGVLVGDDVAIEIDAEMTKKVEGSGSTAAMQNRAESKLESKPADAGTAAAKGGEKK